MKVSGSMVAILVRFSSMVANPDRSASSLKAFAGTVVSFSELGIDSLVSPVRPAKSPGTMLNQDQDGMCISGTLRVGLEFTQ